MTTDESTHALCHEADIRTFVASGCGLIYWKALSGNSCGRFIVSVTILGGTRAFFPRWNTPTKLPYHYVPIYVCSDR